MKFKYVELEVEGSNSTVQEALKALGTIGEPRFSVRFDDDEQGVYTLAKMVEANSDDPDLCDWMRSAHIGEESIEGGGASPLVCIKRVS